jgi:hypothetical protein
MPAVYTLIAETWSRSASPPSRQHFDVVLEGVQQFPRDTTLLMQATLLAAKQNFREEAGSLAKLGVKVSTNPGDKDRFQLMAAAFERDAAGAQPKPAEDAPSSQTTKPYLLK